MFRKTISGPVRFKADGDEGEFEAVFSTLNVKDADRDVTLPGAFSDGEKVRIAFWGHRWDDLPVGRGEIHSDEKEAWVDGQFFLDTEAGRETYRTVKNLGELQEWSYGYEILERSDGEFEGDQVQFLRKLRVIEVSPVMLGAGVDTRTRTIKGTNVAALKAAWEALFVGPKEADQIQVLHDVARGFGAKCGGDEGPPEGEAQKGKPSGQVGPSVYAAQIAAELLESGVE